MLTEWCARLTARFAAAGWVHDLTSRIPDALKQDVPAAQGDRDLEHRARRERDEDLRDRELKMESNLPDHLERRDRGREMQPWVAQFRQDDRILCASNRERQAAGGRCGMRAHIPMLDAERRTYESGTMAA